MELETQELLVVNQDEALRLMIQFFDDRRLDREIFCSAQRLRVLTDEKIRRRLERADSLKLVSPQNDD